MQHWGGLRLPVGADVPSLTRIIHLYVNNQKPLWGEKGQRKRARSGTNHVAGKQIAVP
jgi:hypothetical protein